MRYVLPFAVVADWTARYPPGVKVATVQVIHRHGPRAPAEWRMPERYAFHWPHCRAQNALLGISVGGTEVGAFGERALYRRRSAVEQIHTEPPDPAANCRHGQLTDAGAASMAQLGAALRFQYIESGLLPVDNAYFRSTDYERTLQSVRALATGLFPGSSRPVIHTRDTFLETANLFLPCPELELLAKRAQTEYMYNERDLIESFPLPASRYLTAGLQGGPISLIALYDTLTSASAHGVPFPPGVGNAEMRLLNQLFVTHTYGSMLNEPVRTVRLYCGRFIAELLDNAAFAHDRELRCSYESSGVSEAVTASPISPLSDDPVDSVYRCLPIYRKSTVAPDPGSMREIKNSPSVKSRIDRDDEIAPFAFDEDELSRGQDIDPTPDYADRPALSTLNINVKLTEINWKDEDRADAFVDSEIDGMEPRAAQCTYGNGACQPCSNPAIQEPANDAATAHSCNNTTMRILRKLYSIAMSADSRSKSQPVAQQPVALTRVTSVNSFHEPCHEPDPVYEGPTIRQSSRAPTLPVIYEEESEHSDCVSRPITPDSAVDISAEGSEKDNSVRHPRVMDSIFNSLHSDEDKENHIGSDGPHWGDGDATPPFAQQYRDTDHSEALQQRLQIYSGHDSTLACMLVSFKVVLRSNPSFSSSIILEHLEIADDTYVRVLYNNVPLIQYSCLVYAKELPAHTACRFDEFKRNIAVYTCTDILHECGIDI